MIQKTFCNSSTQFIKIYFFFSSRRRHTILQGDWSSDVCSSDLDVRLYDPDTTLVAWLPRAELSYNPLEFAAGRVVLFELALREPLFNIVQHPSGRLNAEELLRLGGPDTAQGPRGPATLILFRNVRIEDGTVMLRLRAGPAPDPTHEIDAAARRAPPPPPFRTSGSSTPASPTGRCCTGASRCAPTAAACWRSGSSRSPSPRAAAPSRAGSRRSARPIPGSSPCRRPTSRRATSISSSPAPSSTGCLWRAASAAAPWPRERSARCTWRRTGCSATPSSRAGRSPPCAVAARWTCRAAPEWASAPSRWTRRRST